MTTIFVVEMQKVEMELWESDCNTGNKSDELRTAGHSKRNMHDLKWWVKNAEKERIFFLSFIAKKEIRWNII
jgi:hypothetical protein